MASASQVFEEPSSVKLVEWHPRLCLAAELANPGAPAEAPGR